MIRPTHQGRASRPMEEYDMHYTPLAEERGAEEGADEREAKRAVSATGG